MRYRKYDAEERAGSVMAARIKARRIDRKRQGRPRRYRSCDLTHTATSGLSAALAANPQDAETWLRNIAGFLPGPQYAVTSTSSALH
jgi:hypothetical protein